MNLDSLAHYFEQGDPAGGARLDYPRHPPGSEVITLSSISEAVKNRDESKIFRPADYDDFLNYIDYANTEEQLFSRLTYWLFQGLPADQNEKYDMVRERVNELSRRGCRTPGPGRSGESGAQDVDRVLRAAASSPELEPRDGPHGGAEPAGPGTFSRPDPQSVCCAA